MAINQPAQTPCPHCGGPVYVLATTCVHCRGPLRFNPPAHKGSLEAYRILTGWKQPELPPKEPEDPKEARLVTAKDIALKLGIHRTSLKSADWPEPEIRGRGNRPSQWRWDVLKPILQQQYPREDWDSF